MITELLHIPTGNFYNNKKLNNFILAKQQMEF